MPRVISDWSVGEDGEYIRYYDPYPAQLALEIGQQLQEARKRLGLSRDDVAIAVGMAFSGLRDYESGERIPTVDEALRLAQVLPIRVDWSMSNGLEGIYTKRLNGVYWHYYRVKHTRAYEHHTH